MAKSSIHLPNSTKRAPKRAAASPKLPDADQACDIRSKLVGWYRSHKRDLPWRTEPAVAYQVMVSEVMLQQTQVATVINYFHRFVQAFPTVHALASASEQEVLTLWQGLGYYRRARALHAAAGVIVHEHDGRVPDDAPTLLKLPGVGRYTAGAIASIAYDKSEPLVDGNVARVLARVFAIRQPVDDKVVIAFLWEAATRLVQATPPEKNSEKTSREKTSGGAGELNQGLMELGALVCVPRGPNCQVCPLQTVCKARAKGWVDEIPVPVTRRKPKDVTHHVLAVERRDKWLFCQRPSVGLWSNMWQMPTTQTLELESDQDEGKDVTPAKLAQWAKAKHQLNVSKLVQLGEFKHQTTHRTIRFILWRGSVMGAIKTAKGKASPACTCQWRRLDDLADLPLPNPQKHVVVMLATT